MTCKQAFIKSFIAKTSLSDNVMFFWQVTPRRRAEIIWDCQGVVYRTVRINSVLNKTTNNRPQRWFQQLSNHERICLTRVPRWILSQT